MTEKLTLIVSKKMSKTEDSRVRLTASAREVLCSSGYDTELVGSKGSRRLKVHESFSDDIKYARSVGYSLKELKHIGFVTGSVFKQLTGTNTNTATGILITKVSNLKPEVVPKTSEIINKTLIGADPEFLLFDNNSNVIRANTIIQKEGRIGSDGAMAEVRPPPTTNPMDLVQNIADAFKDTTLTDKISNYKWSAGVYHKDNVRDYPIGGHIHLGNPEGIEKLTSEKKTFLFAVLNKIMDELLALPLIKLDGVTLGKSRRSDCQMAMGNGGYGYYGEWRPCDGRLEHRTLSGMWLMHPVVAEFVLGTAKAIADEMFGIVVSSSYNSSIFEHKGVSNINHKRLYLSEFDDWPNIKIAAEMGCVRSSLYMSNVLNASKTSSITKPFLTNWYKQIKGMSTYKKYSKYIDGLYHILSVPRSQISKIGFDIKENWVNEKPFQI